MRDIVDLLPALPGFLLLIFIARVAGKGISMLGASGWVYDLLTAVISLLSVFGIGLTYVALSNITDRYWERQQVTETEPDVVPGRFVGYISVKPEEKD